MKKTVLVIGFMSVLPLSAYAVCFKSFDVTGIGLTTQEAEKDAEEQAAQLCGSDDHNWSVRRTGFFYMQTSRNQMTATAKYQCCSSW